MSKNQFFEQKGPFPLGEIIKTIGCSGDFSQINNFEIKSFESLGNASNHDMTFLNSNKYQELSIKTKAAACITSPNLSKFLPDKCIKLDVKNILLAVTQVAKMFYPNADMDLPDENLSKSDDVKNLYPDVKFGKNVLIGSNTIIESNVTIENNCSIGSNVILRKTIVKNNVKILDGCIIGKKGFGFFPDKKNNFRYPHIGCVIINEYSEIGCG